MRRNNNWVLMQGTLHFEMNSFDDFLSESECVTGDSDRGMIRSYSSSMLDQLSMDAEKSSLA